MHQQEINRINELLNELNLLLPVVNESHQVFVDIVIDDASSVQKIEFAIVAISDENN